MSRSFSKQSVLAIAVVAGLMATLVSCSSSNDSSSTTTTVFSSPVAEATVQGPITGGKGFIVVAPTPPREGQQPTVFDLKTVGYQEDEYFLSGTASAFTSDTPLTADGMWTTRAAGTAPYSNRIVVRRPSDPKKFNGTVIVEWLNVTAGIDTAPDWTYMATEMTRSGYAWIGVSAQRVGIEGGGMSLGVDRVLKSFDPVRYGSLSHPGDNYSYDMFSQAGAVVRRNSSAVLGDLKVKNVMAMGESQSASRLTTYINGIAPTAKVFDGYFVHSRSGNAAPLSVDPLPAVSPVLGTTIRADFGLPVLTFSAETDVAGARGYVKARQPDTETFRGWEATGTAHADYYNLGGGGFDNGDGKNDITYFASMLAPPNSVYDGLITCAAGINTGPHTYILRTALRDLNTWITKGVVPASQPQLEVDAAGTGYNVDELGIAKGGIRTPHVDVPIAVLTGLGQKGNAFCQLFGGTVPLTQPALQARYGTHNDFVAKFSESAKNAVSANAILKDDLDHLIAAAKASSVLK
ncbi:MAG: alpha/beta hydrolase domain-containing protein [Acidimicrobiales bacterium]